MYILKKILMLFCSLWLVAGMSACRQAEEVSEETGDLIEEGVDETMDAAEETGDMIEEGVDETLDAAEKAKNEIEDDM